MKELGLRAGDWVTVKSQAEILATLKNDATLDRLPFQPEMLAFCGKRMRVAKVAHKTCDNIKKTGGRKMEAAVHLEGGRCNGAAHGGCQADCVFFWKEAWLRRDDEVTQTLPNTQPSSGCTVEAVQASVQAVGERGSENPTWVCQTTALYDATSALAWWDVRQYIRDVTSGNHQAWHMIKILTAGSYRNLVGLGFGYRYLVGLYNAFQKLRGGRPFPEAKGLIADGKPTPTGSLDLKVGEWVEVKTREEILPTITQNGMNRGMRYDMEMLAYSGNRYRVQMRVDKLINEQTGKMMEMKSPCIQLEDVYCRANCAAKRLGCPRASNTYWREIWLKRVEGPKQNA